MMRYILFFLFLSVSLFGQSKKGPKGFISIDPSAENFQRLMSNESPSLEVLDTMIQMSRLYLSENRDTALLIIEKVIGHSKDLKTRKGKNTFAKSLSSKGSFMGPEGLETLLEARKAFEAIGNKNGMASTDRIRGLLFLNAERLKESMEAYLSCIKIYKEEKTDPRALLSPLEGISSIYFTMGEYEKSQQYLSEAIAISDTTDSAYKRASLRHKKAKLLFEIGLIYSEKTDSINTLVYRDSAQLLYQQAIKEAGIALSIAEEQGDPAGIVYNYEALAEFNIHLGNFEEGKRFAEDAIAMATKSGDQLLQFINKSHLATALSGQGKYKQAIPIAEEVYQFAKKRDLIEALPKVYDLLIELYISNGEPQRALEMLTEKKSFDKKQNRNETKKAVTEAEAKFQTVEKEKQILQQRNDILELESANAKARKQKNYIIVGGLLIGLIGFFAYRINKIQKDRNDKKEFAEALIFAQEEERKRISRDLHDGVGQSLLLIKKQMEGTRDVTLENQKMISETLEEVRSISRDLHPFHLDKFGLTATIKDTIQKIEQSTELFITQEIDDIDSELSSKSEIHLYRTIQEALSNIVKHAQATAAKVSIENQTDQIKIVIQDNGKGFDLELAEATSKSLGIRTMYERISAIGGQLKIGKGAANGTTVTIKIPKK